MGSDVYGNHLVRISSTENSSVDSVTASASSTTLLEDNDERTGAVIFNDSASALYVKFGATATTSSYTYKLVAYDTLEFPLPIYTGVVDGIWDSATGNARVTELS